MGQDLSIGIDGYGRIVWVSHVQIDFRTHTVTRPEDLIGTHFLKQITPEYSGLGTAAFQTAMSGRSTTFEMRDRLGNLYEATVAPNGSGVLAILRPAGSLRPHIYRPPRPLVEITNGRGQYICANRIVTHEGRKFYSLERDEVADWVLAEERPRLRRFLARAASGDPQESDFTADYGLAWRCRAECVDRDRMVLICNELGRYWRVVVPRQRGPLIIYEGTDQAEAELLADFHNRRWTRQGAPWRAKLWTPGGRGLKLPRPAWRAVG